MDSLVCAGLATSDYQDVYALHMNYGQKTSARERISFDEICEHYKISRDKRKIIDIDKDSFICNKNVKQFYEEIIENEQ